MNSENNNSSENGDSENFSDMGISHFENPEECGNIGEVRGLNFGADSDVENVREQIDAIGEEVEGGDYSELPQDAEDFTSEQYYSQNFGKSEASSGKSCGVPCVIFSILFFGILFAFLSFLAHSCSPQKMGDGASAAFSRIVEAINKPGQRHIFASVKLNELSGEDKYVVASLNETLSQECKETRYGFTATYKIKVRANFQYYVKLEGFTASFENLSGNRMRVIADFGDLTLNEPVAYEVDSQSISTRPFAVDSNKMQTEFMRDEFPKILGDEGREIRSMIAARYQAALSLEKLLRSTLLPRMGFDKNYIENNVEIKIEFGAALGEEFPKMNPIEINLK